MGGAIFLCCWLFGMTCSALEPASSWVEPDLGVEIYTFWGSTWWLIFPGPGNSLVVQPPRLGAPTLDVQARPLAKELTACKLCSAARGKEKEKKENIQKNTRQIRKTKTNSNSNTKKEKR